MEKSSDYYMIKKSTLKNWTIVILGLLVIYLLLGNGTGNIMKNGGGKDLVPTVGATGFEISENDPVMGDPDAPISVVEFSDFECPFCSRAFYGAVSELKASEEFKNGEINFVYKQFPLTSIHRYAQKAAEASICAGNQGEFWAYHDTLFANQGALDIASLKKYAGQLGLDQSEFDSCLDSGDSEKQVSDDLEMAAKSGGRGTPYFVVYNKKTGETSSVSGAVPYSQIASAIASVK